MSDSPWSIKGVSRADREIAKHEARKSGEPIGVWLSRRIRTASDATPQIERRGPSHNAGNQAGDGPPEADRRQPATAAGRRASDHPEFGFGPGKWHQARETILAREDSRFTEGVAALRDRVRTLENRLEVKPDAVAELDARVRALADRIGDLTDRLDTLEGDRVVERMEYKFDRLETDVMEVDRFARHIPVETAESLDGLARQIEQLVDRMRVVETHVLPGKRKPGFFGRLLGRKSR